MPSGAIEAFIDGADRTIDSLNSFMLVRHGQVIAEGWWAPYNAQSPHSMYSLSKSFTSTAVGLAIAEGRFSLDDEVLKFFPEKAPANPSANLKAMRVRDLLRMNTGHETEPTRPPAQSWRTALSESAGASSSPGTHFLYNTSATYMLSAIVAEDHRADRCWIICSRGCLIRSGSRTLLGRRAPKASAMAAPV